MPSPEVRRMLIELEHEVADAPLASAAAIRARGDSSRARRRVAASASVIVLAAGVSVGGAQLFDGAPTRHDGGSPSASPQGLKVRLFMSAGATGDEKQAVEARLGTLRLIGAVHYRSRDESWQAFRKEFRDSPELVNITKPDALLATFEFTLADPADYEAVETQLRTLPGVEGLVEANTSGLPWTPIPARTGG